MTVESKNDGLEGLDAVPQESQEVEDESGEEEELDPEEIERREALAKLHKQMADQ